MESHEPESRLPPNQRRLAMSRNSSSPTRRSVITASAAAGTVRLLQGDSNMATEDEVRPFSFHAPEAELADLRKRINATKWPEREQVTDDSQGVQLDTIQKLPRS